MTRTNTVRALSIVVGLLMAAPALAQDAAQLAKVPPSVRAGVQTTFMTEKLHLTPEQRTKVEAINLKFANQMQPVLEGSSGPFARMREAKKLDTAKDGELHGVLSADQYKDYLAAKDELRERVKQKALENAAQP